MLFIALTWPGSCMPAAEGCRGSQFDKAGPVFSRGQRVDKKDAGLACVRTDSHLHKDAWAKQGDLIKNGKQAARRPPPPPRSSSC